MKKTGKRLSNLALTLICTSISLIITKEYECFAGRIKVCLDYVTKCCRYTLFFEWE